MRWPGMPAMRSLQSVSGRVRLPTRHSSVVGADDIAPDEPTGLRSMFKRCASVCAIVSRHPCQRACVV